MIIKSYTHEIASRQEFEMVKITDQVEKDVAASGITAGVVFVISMHTTTAIMINESLPCVEKDIELTLKNEQGTTKVVKNAGMEILGAAFREVPQELKKQLNLGSGVEVTGVTEGKMKAAGVRKGFIILKANGQVIRTVNDLEDVLKAATLSPDQVLFLSGMFPSGKRANYAVDLTQE